jgi:uncharacterized protein (DUF58 family)
MNREKIRLRPTGLWLLFGPILGCMWLAAINYSNNLVYAILYLIASLTFVSIFHTWRNLAALEVEHLRVHSVFAGGQIRVEIHFRNRGLHPVYGLSLLRLEEDRGWRRAIPLTPPGVDVLRVNPGDTRAVDLFFPAGRRGRYRLNSLLLRSSYPFGLVHASFRLPADAEYFVYPEPRGDALFPELRTDEQNGIPIGAKSGDDFAGVRTYSPGESLRHVDWKAYARGRPLVVKQFVGGDDHELWLDAATLPDLSLEDRLSQLACWVVAAEREDLPYALRLGDAVLPRGLGPEQARRALQILAVGDGRIKIAF